MMSDESQGTVSLENIELWTCEPGCQEFRMPYTHGRQITLEIIPDPDAVFVGWEPADGKPLDGIYPAQLGDVL